MVLMPSSSFEAPPGGGMVALIGARTALCRALTALDGGHAQEANLHLRTAGQYLGEADAEGDDDARFMIIALRARLRSTHLGAFGPRKAQRARLVWLMDQVAAVTGSLDPDDPDDPTDP